MWKEAGPAEGCGGTGKQPTAHGILLSFWYWHNPTALKIRWLCASLHRVGRCVPIWTMLTLRPSGRTVEKMRRQGGWEGRDGRGRSLGRWHHLRYGGNQVTGLLRTTVAPAFGQSCPYGALLAGKGWIRKRACHVRVHVYTREFELTLLPHDQKGRDDPAQQTDACALTRSVGNVGPPVYWHRHATGSLTAFKAPVTEERGDEAYYYSNQRTKALFCSCTLCSLRAKEPLRERKKWRLHSSHPVHFSRATIPKGCSGTLHFAHL
jgi:hypothetical protein